MHQLFWKVWKQGRPRTSLGCADRVLHVRHTDSRGARYRGETLRGARDVAVISAWATGRYRRDISGGRRAGAAISRAGGVMSARYQALLTEPWVLLATEVRERVGAQSGVGQETPRGEPPGSGASRASGLRVAVETTRSLIGSGPPPAQIPAGAPGKASRLHGP